MRSPYENRIAEHIEIQRAIVQGDARICSSNFGKAWKALFPYKSAEELAARVGCTVRTAAYEISGERHPSAQSLLALMIELTPNWK